MKPTIGTNVYKNQPHYIRCTVHVGNSIESILEAEEDAVFDHIRETLEAYEEDLGSLLITIGDAEDIPKWRKVKADCVGGGG
jgi:hypothetical protein